MGRMVRVQGACLGAHRQNEEHLNIHLTPYGCANHLIYLGRTNTALHAWLGTCGIRRLESKRSMIKTRWLCIARKSPVYHEML